MDTNAAYLEMEASLDGMDGLGRHKRGGFFGKLRRRIAKIVAKSPLIKKMPKPMRKLIKKAGVPGLLTPDMARRVLKGQMPGLPLQKQLQKLVLKTPGTKFLIQKMPPQLRRIALQYGVPGLMTPEMMRKGRMMYDKKFRYKMQLRNRRYIRAPGPLKKGGPYIALPPPRFVGRPVLPPINRWTTMPVRYPGFDYVDSNSKRGALGPGAGGPAPIRDVGAPVRPPESGGRLFDQPVEMPAPDYNQDGRFVDDQATQAEADASASPDYPPGKAGFTQWLQDTMPDFYYQVQRRKPELLADDFYSDYMEGLGMFDDDDDLGASDTAAPADSWSSKLLDFAKVAGLAWRENKIMNMQLKRAKQGLPPMDTSALAPAVQVGLGAPTRNMMMIGAAALAAAFILPKVLAK